jgi:predicted nucleotidyltransferase
MEAVGVDDKLLSDVVRPAKIILFGSAATGDVEYPVDVVVILSKRFSETKDLVGSIAYPANKYGRVLYEAA